MTVAPLDFEGSINREAAYTAFIEVYNTQVPPHDPSTKKHYLLLENGKLTSVLRDKASPLKPVLTAICKLNNDHTLSQQEKEVIQNVLNFWSTRIVEKRKENCCLLGRALTWLFYLIFTSPEERILKTIIEVESQRKGRASVGTPDEVSPPKPLKKIQQINLKLLVAFKSAHISFNEAPTLLGLETEIRRLHANAVQSNDQTRMSEIDTIRIKWYDEIRKCLDYKGELTVFSDPSTFVYLDTKATGK